MNETTSEKLRDYALQANQDGQTWHYHFLTPECQLNDKDEYALVLEVPDQTYVNYSPAAKRDLSKELAKLLHGDEIVQGNEVSDDSYTPSGVIEKIVKRARELSEQGIEWHHHMLFPTCQFNQNKPRWTLLLEDPQNNSVLESLSDSEPVDDLKQIEKLFYSQK